MGVNIRQTDIVKETNATTVKKVYKRSMCDIQVARDWLASEESKSSKTYLRKKAIY